MFGLQSRNLIIGGLAVILAILLSFSFLSNAFAAGPNNYTKDNPAVKFSCFQKDKDGNLAVNKTTGLLTPCPIDTGDNAWMLTSAALVLMMTPGGLAIFYSGLSRQKNAVNTLHMVFITTGIIGIQWVLWGYSLAFGPDATGNGFIGTLDWAGLNNVLHDVPSDVYGGLGGPTIPHMTYMAFQMMFAIITPALIVAALAERMKFSVFVIFMVLWATFVYDFCAHWTWSLGFGGTHVGWTGALPSLDFAGGTVIHITSGWSGLVIALMLGRRLGYGKIPMEPHNISLIVLGGALLWTGWFGFNAGSAGGSSIKRNKCIRCNSGCYSNGSSNLGTDSMGSHRKAFYSRCSIWCSSWPSSNHTGIRICISNVGDNYRYCCFGLLLWCSNVQEQTQMGRCT